MRSSKNVTNLANLPLEKNVPLRGDKDPAVMKTCDRRKSREIQCIGFKGIHNGRHVHLIKNPQRLKLFANQARSPL